MSDLHFITSSAPGTTCATSQKTAKDREGEVFGRLTLVKYLGGRNYRYLCVCVCGNTRDVCFGNLKSGKTKSCGCLNTETLSNFKHGKIHTTEYHAWKDMWSRCTSPNNEKYPLYKDRTPPKEWKDFAVFLAHVGPKPSPELSLDRIDNDKPYGPGNVRWATVAEQANNRSNNHKITFAGKTQGVGEWAKELGLKVPTLSNRLNKLGWSVERSLTKV